MKRAQLILFFCFAILVFGLALQSLRMLRPAPSTVAATEDSTPTASPKREPMSAAAEAQDTQAIKAIFPTKETLNRAEIESVEQMTETLSVARNQDKKINDLVSALEGRRQKPFVTHDQNPHTGEMAIVRTESPLKGTRYFHAQYFKDQDGQPFLQHASFEIRPAPDAMETAEKTVQNMFKDLPRAHRRTDDFVEWALPDQYVVWIKKMAVEELQDNPFNAYSSDDVGTIRVAIEARVHEEDEH